MVPAGRVILLLHEAGHILFSPFGAGVGAALMIGCLAWAIVVMLKAKEEAWPGGQR